MKVVIDIDDYILDTDIDIDSNWVNVCNDELAESLNNAVKLSDVLQEIRREIEERINNCGDGNFKDGLCEAFDIVYCKMKEFSE